MPRKNPVEDMLNGDLPAAAEPITTPAALPTEGGNYTYNERGELVPYTPPTQE